MTYPASDSQSMAHTLRCRCLMLCIANEPISCYTDTCLNCSQVSASAAATQQACQRSNTLDNVKLLRTVDPLAVASYSSNTSKSIHLVLKTVYIYTSPLPELHALKTHLLYLHVLSKCGLLQLQYCWPLAGCTAIIATLHISLATNMNTPDLF